MEVLEKVNKKKALAPKLRFKGFENEWKSDKLEEIADINPTCKNLPEKFIYIDLESVVKGQLLKENEILKNGSPSRAQRLLQQNDILFQMVRPYQMNNLFFDKKGDYVASTGYAQIRTKENPKFIYQYLHLQKFVDKVIERCTGTSYPSINSSDLANIFISIPSLPEQQKIASFLSTVDEKIKQLTRKKELLEQYKKGVMQQLFSGKLRFKDERRKIYPKWEEKKLGDIFEERNERGGDDLELLSVSINSGIQKQSDSSKRDTSNSDKSKYKCVLKGDIAYNTMRMWQGSSAVSTLDGIVSPAYTVLKANSKNESIFFGYLFKMTFMINIFQRYSQGMTSDTWSLKYPVFSEIKVMRPTKEEQKQIADYLSAIDKKIETVSKQIAQTQTFKKGLLQQMFV